MKVNSTLPMTSESVRVAQIFTDAFDNSGGILPNSRLVSTARLERNLFDAAWSAHCRADTSHAHASQGAAAILLKNLHNFMF